MARIRQIKPEFYLDDELARCPRDARLMFPGLWCLADRAGRLQDRPARIKAQLFPYDDDITVKDVEVFLGILADLGFIQRYLIAGKRYIQIRSFVKHQHCHMREPESQLPEPPKVTAEPGVSTGQAPVKHRSGPAASGYTASGYMDNGIPLKPPKGGPVSVLDFWNSQPGLIHHKSVNGLERYVKAALKAYSLDEIKTAIKRYSEVRTNPGKYRKVYNWTLGEFVSREGGKNMIRFNIDNWQEAFMPFGEESTEDHLQRLKT